VTVFASPVYVRLREGQVARTACVSDDVMVDTDSDDRVLGVEVLDGSDWRDALAALAREGRLAVYCEPMKMPQSARTARLGLPEAGAHLTQEEKRR
jgi:uncharacterized protein YuzE